MAPQQAPTSITYSEFLKNFPKESLKLWEDALYVC